MKKLYTFIALILLLVAPPAMTQEGPTLPQTPDDKLNNVTVGFDGQWMPDRDPAKIGANNFKTLQNMRPTPGGDGIEGVLGYSKINTTLPTKKQDALNYTEQDASSRVTITDSTTITVTDLDNDEEAWVVADKGAARFNGDFEFHVDVKCTANSGSADRCVVWMLANAIDSPNDIDIASGDWLLLYWVEIAGSDYLRIRECNAGVLSTGGTSIALVIGTQYYCRLVRDESVGTYGTLYCYIYSDASHSTLVDTMTVALTEKQDFRFLYWVNGYNTGGSGKAWDGVISNLEVPDFDFQSGFHFKKDSPSESHVLVQTDNGIVWQNETAIPDVGDFSSEVLHTDSSGFGLGRFSDAPDGMTYCNGEECLSWSGDEMALSGFLMIDNSPESLTLTFGATETIIDDGGGDFVTAGYKPGQIIDITGSVDNNRSWTIIKIDDSGATNDRITVSENAMNAQASDVGCVMTPRIETLGYRDPIDYTEAVNNTLTTTGNVAVIGGSGNDSYTNLLLHCDDSNYSTTFTDSSDDAHSPSANGDARIDTSQAVFGPSSGYFDGTGDYVATSDDTGASDHWYMAASALTIDFQFRTPGVVVAQGFFSQFTDNDNRVFMWYDTSFIHFTIVDATNTTVNVSVAWSYSKNTDYHIALIRGWGGNVNDWAVTINGSQAGSTETDSSEWPDLADDFDVGRTGTGGVHLSGHIDEFRISKGIARWTTNFTPPSRAYRDAQRQHMVLSTRPIKGLTYYVDVPNTVASTMSGKVFNGNSFSDLIVTDGTRPGTISLAQTGKIWFASTVDEAKPLHFEGTYLYAYLFELSAGQADISHVTLDAPMQPIVNVWDEVYRLASSFQFYLGTTPGYNDFTIAVSQYTGAASTFTADISAMTATDHIIFIFEEERMAGLYFTMASGGEINVNPSIPTIEYWDGTDWVSVGTITDGTSGDDNDWETLGQSGLMSWNPPGEDEEQPQTLFGVRGFTYRLTASANLDSTIEIDTLFGVPAQSTVKPFKFPSQFKERALLCGYTKGNEGNRIDFSAPGSSDIWNGELSSMDGIYSIRIPTQSDLTCGTELYNRYGSNVFAFWLAFTNTETFVIAGDDPAGDNAFKVFPVSDTIGCPAPLTLATATIGHEMVKGVPRQIALWVSPSGPKKFDGGVIREVLGIETYFDPSSDNVITLSAIEDARGWYDSTYAEYNIVFPVDSLWLAYSLIQEKWYEKVPATYPKCGFPVYDTDGVQYIYAGLDTGYMMRLENGNTWDGTGIAQIAETGDFFPSNDPWQQTEIRRFKVAAKDITESASLAITHYADTATSGTSLTAVDLSSGSNRIVRNTQGANLLGWSHRLKFSTTTSSTAKGFQPLAWGYQWQYKRVDK